MSALRSFALLIWARAGHAAVLPDELLIALAAAGAGTALVAWSPSWRRARHLVTLLHELGHMSVGILLGRKVVGVRLHRDSSGSTSLLGPAKRPLSTALISFAGYPAPAAVGFGLVEAVHHGRADLAAALLTGALFAMALRVANWWGALLIIGGFFGALLAEVFVPAVVVAVVALFAAGIAVAGSARTITEQHRIRLSGQVGKTDLGFDAFGVSRRTHLPAVLIDAAWWLCWFLLAAGSVVVVAAVRL